MQGTDREAVVGEAERAVPFSAMHSLSPLAETKVMLLKLRQEFHRPGPTALNAKLLWGKPASWAGHKEQNYCYCSSHYE